MNQILSSVFLNRRDLIATIWGTPWGLQSKESDRNCKWLAFPYDYSTWNIILASWLKISVCCDVLEPRATRLLVGATLLPSVSDKEILSPRGVKRNGIFISTQGRFERSLEGLLEEA